MIQAARYYVGMSDGQPCVVMEEVFHDELLLTVVQTCQTFVAAEKAVDRWQKKENAAVAKANKKRGE